MSQQMYGRVLTGSCMTAILYVSFVAVVFLHSSYISSFSTTKQFEDSYMSQRQQFIHEENHLRLGYSLPLCAKEKLVNRLLMKHKSDTIDSSRWQKVPYPTAVDFVEAKAVIERSVEFDIIRMMPKGGNLHVFDTALTSIEWFIKNLTYLPDLYSQKDPNTGARRYKYSTVQPGKDWLGVEEQRRDFKDKETFDNMLKDEMMIIGAVDPRGHPPSSHYDATSVFRIGEAAISDLLSSMDNLLNYFERGMMEYLADGVTYIEVRARLFIQEEKLRFLHVDFEEFLQSFIPRLKLFKQRNPDFIGIKFITSSSMPTSRDSVESVLQETMRLVTRYPELVKGYDMGALVDQHTGLTHYTLQLLRPSFSGPGLLYFFHGLEIDWSEDSDINVVDALLLNVTRAGHVSACQRHPKVWDAIGPANIVMELSLISDQVLGLISDLRNHPGATLFAEGAPVVVTSGSPARWGASPLSHDFYMALMGAAAMPDDLRLLKQLAVNSLRYSTMTAKERDVAMVKWQDMWNTFIDDVITKYRLA